MKGLCLECAYFRQHYIKHKRGYQKIALGHCVSAHVKHKQAGEKACERFKAIK